MEHGTPLSEPPPEALKVTEGVETSAQQEETEKPLNTEEDTQKKKRFRRRYRKPKSQVQESKPKHSFLAELPFANVDIGAAFEIPKTLEKKGKNKRKINNLSENKDDDMSKKKKTANYFVSFPISNPKILGDIQTFQDAVLEKDERLTRAMIPKGSFHITLFVMHLSNEDEVNLAMSALLESKKPIENVLEGKEVVLTFHGVDEFKHEVVYGKIREGESVDTLTKIAEIMVKIFQEKGIITVGYKGFVPHLTFLKLSRAPKLRKQGIKKIDASLYKDFQDHYFGDDTLFRIDLCSMLKKRQSSGYYHTEASIYIDSSSHLHRKMKPGINDISVSGAVLKVFPKSVPSPKKRNISKDESTPSTSNIFSGSSVCNCRDLHTDAGMFSEDTSTGLTFFSKLDKISTLSKEAQKLTEDPPFKSASVNATRSRTHISTCPDISTGLQNAYSVGVQTLLVGDRELTSQQVVSQTSGVVHEHISQTITDTNQQNAQQFSNSCSLGHHPVKASIENLVSLQKHKMQAEKEQWESNEKIMNLVLERLTSIQEQQRYTNKNLKGIRNELAYIGKQLGHIVQHFQPSVGISTSGQSHLTEHASGDQEGEKEQLLVNTDVLKVDDSCHAAVEDSKNMEVLKK
ncbi:uncharacterized protein LOC134587102 [Pelobates fuscus]|uniref:uncharacterized protein LOC134587102 n=1 Tax=Pelobates fuscus TaxID=191477 RepID=UPI002FE45E69